MQCSHNSVLSKDIFFQAKNRTKINSIPNNSSALRENSVIKAKKALTKNLLAPREAIQMLSNLEAAREAIKIFNERNNIKLTDNITEIPKFSENKAEPVNLSERTKETFVGIGIKAREAFIEEQLERAMLYNIPYQTYGDNYYKLMTDSDHYEFLLEKAEELNINWDISKYDPIALEQAIEEATHNSYLQDKSLRFYFSITRRAGV
jgi:hypothetical protein